MAISIACRREACGSLERCGSFAETLRVVLRVQESVAHLVLMPGLLPTVFVIVGDQAPPFMRAETRNQFSQTMVPFVVLIPRSIPLQAQGPKPAQTAAVSSFN